MGVDVPDAERSAGALGSCTSFDGMMSLAARRALSEGRITDEKREDAKMCRNADVGEIGDSGGSERMRTNLSKGEVSSDVY